MLNDLSIGHLLGQFFLTIVLNKQHFQISKKIRVYKLTEQPSQQLSTQMLVKAVRPKFFYWLTRAISGY